MTKQRDLRYESSRDELSRSDSRPKTGGGSFIAHASAKTHCTSFDLAIKYRISTATGVSRCQRHIYIHTELRSAVIVPYCSTPRRKPTHSLLIVPQGRGGSATSTRRYLTHATRKIARPCNYKHTKYFYKYMPKRRKKGRRTTFTTVVPGATRDRSPPPRSQQRTPTQGCRRTGKSRSGGSGRKGSPRGRRCSPDPPGGQDSDFRDKKKAQEHGESIVLVRCSRR